MTAPKIIDEANPTSLPAPRANGELIGHEKARGELLAAASSGRLHHAWLITGARGIGKATLAYRFARFLLATPDMGGLFGVPETLQIDPDDPVFQRVASGGHPDLLTVERKFDEKRGRMRNEIVIDDVRAVVRFLNLTASAGGWRIVVVDGAEDMNRNAANALLKVLEEPPPNTVMLLVSHAPGRLPATVRSRCRRLQLQPLAPGDVMGLLTRGHPDLIDDDAAQLVRLAEGSIGRALDLAAEGGIDLYRELIGLIDSLPELDTTAIHGLGDRLAKRGGEGAFRTFTGLMSWWLARAIRSGAVKTGAGHEDVVPGEGEVMARLLERRSLDQWLEVWEKITRLFADVDRVNLDRKQVVLTAFLTLQNATRA
ncbi:MAG: DNA polymerase III subunit delta' [Alphaproteobacteria bacterium]